MLYTGLSQVLLGEHDYNTNGETESLRMNVAQIKNHRKYDDVTTDYDFSMLKLKSSVNFCDYEHIRPVYLPSDASLNYAMETATTTGWGTTSSGGSVSSKLREVDVKVLTNSQCGGDYSYPSSWITARQSSQLSLVEHSRDLALIGRELHSVSSLMP